LKWLLAAERAGQRDTIEKRFRLGKTPGDYLAFAEAASNLGRWRNYWHYLRPACEEAQVITGLQQSVQNHKWTAVTDRVCAVMLAGPDCDLRIIGDSLKTLLNQPHTLNVEEGGAIIRTLFRLRNKTPEAEASIQTIIRSGWGFHHLQIAANQKDMLALSSWMMAAVFYCPEAILPAKGPVTFAPIRRGPRPNVPGIATPPEPANVEVGAETYKAICRSPGANPPGINSLIELTLELSSVTELFAKWEGGNVPKPLLNWILARHAEREDAYVLFPPQLIVDNFRNLNVAVGVEATERLVTISLQKGDLLAHLLQVSFSLERAELYRLALMKVDSPELRDKLVSSLKELEKERWVESIEKRDHRIGLAFDLSKKGVKLDLGYPLKDALTEIAQRSVSTTLPSHIDRELTSSIVSMLTDEQIDLLKSALLDQVISSDRAIRAIIDLFPSLINDCQLLSNEADRLVRDGYRNMLARLDPTELAWVAQISKKCPEILKKCKPATEKDFIERVRDAAKKPLSEPARSHVAELAGILRLKAED
jgi:hypothetical protein